MLGCCPHIIASVVQDLMFQSPGEDDRGSCRAWAAHGELHTPEETEVGPDLTLPRKAPSGAPRAARSCNRAPAAALQPLAVWQCRGWRKGCMCQRSRCRSRDGRDRERDTWQHGSCDFGCWECTRLRSTPPHLHAAHKARSPSATSNFPNPSADSHSCYLKIK